MTEYCRNVSIILPTETIEKIKQIVDQQNEVDRIVPKATFSSYCRDVIIASIKANE